MSGVGKYIHFTACRPQWWQVLVNNWKSNLPLAACTKVPEKLLIICQHLKTDEFSIKVKISCFSQQIRSNNHSLRLLNPWMVTVGWHQVIATLLRHSSSSSPHHLTHSLYLPGFCWRLLYPLHHTLYSLRPHLEVGIRDPFYRYEDWCSDRLTDLVYHTAPKWWGGLWTWVSVVVTFCRLG